MIDTILNVGDFVEFELLYGNDDMDLNLLQDELNKFVEKFESLNFESANLPYRDFVANKTYINVLPQDKLNVILFDLDGTLINSEQKFFESFRNVIVSHYNYNISYNEYEENELSKNANLISYLKAKKIIDDKIKQEEIMEKVYEEYERRFIELLNDDKVILNFELLKRLKRKGLTLGLVSTSRRKFIELLLQKLNITDLFKVIISREDVSNLKPSPDAYDLALNLLDVKSTNCIAFEDSERGIKASSSANIKTIQIKDFSNFNKEKTNKSDTENLSRVLLAIINNISN